MKEQDMTNDETKTLRKELLASLSDEGLIEHLRNYEADGRGPNPPSWFEPESAVIEILRRIKTRPFEEDGTSDVDRVLAKCEFSEMPPVVGWAVRLDGVELGRVYRTERGDWTFTSRESTSGPSIPVHYHPTRSSAARKLIRTVLDEVRRMTGLRRAFERVLGPVE